MPIEQRPDRVPGPYLDLVGAGGEKLDVRGVYRIPIRILGRIVHNHFYVVRGLTSDSIIGNDFIENHGLSYDSISKQPFFQSSLNWTRGSLVSACQVTIPARSSRAIRVKAKSIPGVVAPGPTVAISSISTTSSPVVGNDSLVNIEEDGSTWVIVDNIHDTDFEIPRNGFVGTVEKVNEKDVFKLDLEDAPPPKSVPPPRSKPETAKLEMLLSEIREQVKDLPSDLQDLYINLVINNHDVFSADKMDLGQTEDMEHSIHLKDPAPVFTKQFRIPEHHRSVLIEHLQKWIQLKVVSPSRSMFNSPIFCVPKKDGSLRAVLDFRKLNDKSYMDKYSQREISECIDTIGRHQSYIFSSLDLTAGFWQMPLAPKSRPFTAFTIPGIGSFEWNVTPMGLLGSPATFGRLMDHVMRDLKVICYQDDVLVHSKSHMEQIHQLQECFDRLRGHGLKLNIKKCSFGQTNVPYLGYSLTPNGVLPGTEKTEAIKSCEPPRNTRQVREFVGLCNYFRSSISNFALIAKPLNELTSNKAKWEKGQLPPDALAAFQKLKNALINPPVLAYPDPNLDYFLWVDAAVGNETRPGGVGAALIQVSPQGIPQAIGFASKCLQKHENNYSAYLLEQFAIHFGVKYFSHYLKGRPFTIYSDHKPLTHKLSPVHEKTFNNFDYFMQGYNYVIEHKPGRENVVADFLSRNANSAKNKAEVIAVIDLGITNLAELQDRDEKILKLKDALSKSETETSSGISNLKGCLSLDKDILFHKHGNKKRIFAPESLRKRIIQTAHNSLLGGHMGIFKTKGRILERYYWPSLHRDVADHIKTCLSCQRNKPWNRPQRVPMIPLPATDHINARIHIDLFGPLKVSGRGKRYIMVITDSFSKYVELAATVTKEAEEIARAIYDTWISRFTCPKVVVTDNGKEFANKILGALLEHFRVVHNRTSPYHPECNSSSEVFNRTMRQFLQATVEPPYLEWEHLLPSLRLAYNTSVSKATQATPFSLVYAAQPHMPFFDFEKTISYEEDQVEILRELEYVRKRAKENNIRYKQMYAKQYDDKYRVENTQIQVGDFVFVEKCQKQQQANPKLQPLFLGPFKVLEVNDSNIRYKQGKKEKLIHLNHVKKAFMPLQSLMDLEEDDLINLETAKNVSKNVQNSNSANSRPRTSKDADEIAAGNSNSHFASRNDSTISENVSPSVMQNEGRSLIPTSDEERPLHGPSSSPAPEHGAQVSLPAQTPSLHGTSPQGEEERREEESNTANSPPAAARSPSSPLEQDEPVVVAPPAQPEGRLTRSKGQAPPEPLVPRFPIGSRAYIKHRDRMDGTSYSND